MKIKVGDQAIVIAGANKGKKGKVIKTIPDKDQVVIEKVNMRKRHVRKSSQKTGEVVTYEAAIHISNVQLADPKLGTRTRVGYKKLENGKKIRIAKKSGQELK